MSSTRNTKFIAASPETVYNAFTDPDALVAWQAPGEMTAKVHHFDHRVGGGYQMSLYYPESNTLLQGKTEGREDRYTARFVELVPPRRIVEAITFDSDNPAFAGEMTMDVTLVPQAGGTSVTIEFRNLPPGIRPENNELGTEASLQKLARYLNAPSA